MATSINIIDDLVRNQERKIIRRICEEDHRWDSRERRVKQRITRMRRNERRDKTKEKKGSVLEV
jgi:hypothetical protein